MPVSGHAAVSSQALHDDEIRVVCPTRRREHEGGVTLFLISIYFEFPLLATVGYMALGWMDFQSGLVVLVLLTCRKPKSSLEARAAARLLKPQHLPS